MNMSMLDLTVRFHSLSRRATGHALTCCPCYGTCKAESDAAGQGEWLRKPK